MNIPLDNVQLKPKVLLLGCGLFLVGCAAYVVVIRPQQTTIGALQAQYQVEQQRVQVISDYVRTNPDQDKQLASIDMKVTQIDRMLPNTADMGGFLLQLEHAAQQSNVQLSQVRPGQGQAAKITNLWNIPVELTIKGTYFEVLDFLRRLEDNSRFVRIININIYAQENQLESKLALLVYSYGTDEANAKPNR